VLPVELFVMIALMPVVGVVVRHYSMSVRINFGLIFFIRVLWENTSRIAPLPVWVICWIYPYAVKCAILFRFIFCIRFITFEVFVNPIFSSIFFSIFFVIIF
jgi:hypothetical protein